MNTDCGALSSSAKKIFARIKPFFPPDPWKNQMWADDGRVNTNGWYDLRKSADRKRLMEEKKNFLGYLVESEANMFLEVIGSLERFTSCQFTEMMKREAQLLLLLRDLDFQIETMDVVEECQNLSKKKRRISRR